MFKKMIAKDSSDGKVVVVLKSGEKIRRFLYGQMIGNFLYQAVRYNGNMISVGSGDEYLRGYEYDNNDIILCEV